jgi:hypothetical protein
MRCMGEAGEIKKFNINKISIPNISINSISTTEYKLLLTKIQNFS